jgi:hypothetical protein
MKAFNEFLGSLPLVENIDDLTKEIDHDGIQIADYMFLERQIVCEIKTLNKDTKEKIEKIIEDLKDREDYPIFYGEWGVDKIIKNLSNKEEIQRKMAESATSPIEDMIKDANRQIRDTKRLFGLPYAKGIVIIINESVDILDADLSKWRINRCLTKKTKSGTSRFESIDAVWFLDEAHQLLVRPGLNGPISLQIHRPSEDKFVSNYIDYLMTQWAAYVGIPIEFIQEENLRKEQIRGRDLDEVSQKMTRQKFWEKTYNSRPYLRNLPETQLCEYGRKLFEKMTPHFLKNGPRLTKKEMGQYMERFTHLLQEVKHRGLDMRKFEFNRVDLSEYIKPQQGAAGNG